MSEQFIIYVKVADNTPEEVTKKEVPFIQKLFLYLIFSLLLTSVFWLGYISNSRSETYVYENTYVYESTVEIVSENSLGASMEVVVFEDDITYVTFSQDLKLYFSSVDDVVVNVYDADSNFMFYIDSNGWIESFEYLEYEAGQIIGITEYNGVETYVTISAVNSIPDSYNYQEIEFEEPVSETYQESPEVYFVGELLEGDYVVFQNEILEYNFTNEVPTLITVDPTDNDAVIYLLDEEGYQIDVADMMSIQGAESLYVPAGDWTIRVEEWTNSHQMYFSVEILPVEKILISQEEETFFLEQNQIAVYQLTLNQSTEVTVFSEEDAIIEVYDTEGNFVGRMDSHSGDHEEIVQLEAGEWEIQISNFRYQSDMHFQFQIESEDTSEWYQQEEEFWWSGEEA